MRRIDDWLYRRSFWTIAAIGWAFGLLAALLVMVPVVLLWNPAQPYGALLGFTIGALLTAASELFATERWG